MQKLWKFNNSLYDKPDFVTELKNLYFLCLEEYAKKKISAEIVALENK